MKWATRERIRIDRAASAWLILRFVDKDARFEYVPTKGALEASRARDAIPFVIPGAELSRNGSKVTFDAIVEKYQIADPAVHKLALIVREADVAARAEVSPEAPGLKAILHGFYLLEMDDPETLKLELPLFDALYRFCQGKHGAGGNPKPAED